MDIDQQQRLLEFLKSSFDHDGTVHFLAVSAVGLDSAETGQSARYKVRVAITFHDGESVAPYFDGTDLYVRITPSDIAFYNEKDWADGPPAMEGSPNGLALEWVSKLAPPFWVSPVAKVEADKRSAEGSKTAAQMPEDDFTSWF
jgi:hypothetical protein